MKCKTQAGLALVGGYLLGRTKKLKFALMLGGLAAGKGLSTNPSALLKQGTDAVRSNAELTKLVEQARGGLMDAGKAAMVAAASSRLDSVSERLAGRAASLGKPLPDGAGPASDSADEDETAEHAEEDEGPADEQDLAEDEAEPEEDQATASKSKAARPARRESRSRSGAAAPKRSVPRRRSNERARSGARRGEDDG